MKDWADEIELTIADAYSSHGAILAADADGMIAKALRKAKADGMREAAGMLLHQKGVDRARLLDLSTAFKSRANKIEKGQ